MYSWEEIILIFATAIFGLFVLMIVEQIWKERRELSDIP